MAVESAAAPGSGVSFSELDDAKVNRFQMKVMFISGMGFFTALLMFPWAW